MLGREEKTTLERGEDVLTPMLSLLTMVKIIALISVLGFHFQLSSPNAAREAETHFSNPNCEEISF